MVGEMVDDEKPKHAGGRPPFYSNLEDLQAAIDNYFALAVVGQYTITGLALSLGFSERKSLIDYCENPLFVHAIKKAKLRIEQDYEQSLREKGRSGDIFGLKNFGWQDKSEVDQNLSGSVEVKKVTRTIIDPVSGTEHTDT